MTTKNIVVLGAAAAVCCTLAYVTSSGSRVKSPSLAGKRILADFAIADVARVEIGAEKKLVLAAGDKGWSVESLYGYPADVAKIRENILKLQELKVGQVARGRKIAGPNPVELKDSSGKILASVVLGETHMSKPRGQAAQFGGGGYPDGRYIKYGDETVLVKDALEAFDGDPKKWVETRIASVPASDVTRVVFAKGKERVELSRKDSNWALAGLGPKEELDSSKTYSLDSALSYLDFASVADPKLTEAELGFATGSTYTVTLKDGKSYTASVGAAAGSDRYFKISAAFSPVGTNATVNAACEKDVKEFNERTAKWVYTVSSYSAESMSKVRKDLVKAKEEPKEEKKKSEK
jgi:hypothetical protein